MAFKLIQDSTESTTLGYLPESKAMDEEVYALTGTTPDLDPDQGTIQTWTLSGASAPVDTLTSGQSMMLMVNDADSDGVTWPSVTWVGASAPTLATSGYSVITLWKVGTTLYGACAGDVA